MLRHALGFEESVPYGSDGAIREHMVVRERAFFTPETA